MATHPQQLGRSRLLLIVAVPAVLAITGGLAAGRSARHSLERLANQRGAEIGGRVAAAVTAYLRDRRHEADVLAALPWLSAAAQTASQQAVARGLDQAQPADVERRFDRTRQLGADPDLESFLRNYVGGSELIDVVITEDHGFVVLASARPAQFVQRDAPWWQAAMRAGSYEGPARYDAAAATVSIERAVTIRPPQRARPAGVLLTVIEVDRLRYLFRGGDLGDSATLQLVDDQGRVLVSQDTAAAPLSQGSDAKPAGNADSTIFALIPATGSRGAQLSVSVPTNDGLWRVVFHQPTSVAYALALRVERVAWLGALVLLALAIGTLFGLGRWLDHQVTEPVRTAAGVARQVAGGDLALTVPVRAGSFETRDLLSSVQSMIEALRRLVGAIRTSADESAAMAAEISAATEQMSASTQEMTSTTQDLTRRAAEQAQLVRAAADDAGRILHIASALAMGSEDSVRRNADLSKLARHHKGLLDQSITQLAKLASEIEHGVQEAEALAASSAQIQRFVTQAKAVATQTNMLALNAAIEAARAGQQGRGFAVVADEVRKLASVAAAAATETADTVRGVLTRVQATRDRLQRLAQTGAVAREAAQTAAQGLTSVTGEAEANDAWSQEIATSAVEVRRLVDEIAARLNAVAEGTDGLLASAQEIAASSEEQSASTEEIASSANQLAEAADRLQGAVKSFRIVADQAAESPPPPPPSSAPAAPADSGTVGPPALTPEIAT
ncbi:MAG TPA: methyl-accepting chemotaxis protein [Gemmatimonadales bacterium]|nr:methyl-accepting chemotaxis protein [Gemmatimonadales bacterium]